MLRQASLTLQGATIKSVIIIKASSCVLVVKAEDSSPRGIGFKPPTEETIFTQHVFEFWIKSMEKK
jgi:hypothetical protein